MTPTNLVQVVHRLDTEQQPVRYARRLVADTLASWHWQNLIDDAQLAVTELVTNAERHGTAPITLRLEPQANALLIEVTDASPSVPQPREPGDNGGFGLTVTAALGTLTFEPTRTGKTVSLTMHL